MVARVSHARGDRWLNGSRARVPCRMRSEVLAYVTRHIAPLSAPHGLSVSSQCVCEGNVWFASTGHVTVEGVCPVDEDNTGGYRTADLVAAETTGGDVALEPWWTGALAGPLRTVMDRNARKPRRSRHQVATLLNRCDRYPSVISIDSLLRRPDPHELDCGTYLATDRVRAVLNACPDERLAVFRTQPLEPVLFAGVNWRASVHTTRPLRNPRLSAE